MGRSPAGRRGRDWPLGKPFAYPGLPLATKFQHGKAWDASQALGESVSGAPDWTRTSTPLRAQVLNLPCMPNSTTGAMKAPIV